jgi:hypothetical protein
VAGIEIICRLLNGWRAGMEAAKLLNTCLITGKKRDDNCETFSVRCVTLGSDNYIYS